MGGTNANTDMQTLIILFINVMLVQSKSHKILPFCNVRSLDKWHVYDEFHVDKVKKYYALVDLNPFYTWCDLIANVFCYDS